MSNHPRIFRANSSDAAQDMSDANNQRRKSNASSLSEFPAAASTSKSSKKEGLFGNAAVNAAVNAAISGLASTPTGSDHNSNLGFRPVKWDNSTGFDSAFLVNGKHALTHQSGLNFSSPPSMTSTPPVAMFEFTPGNSSFGPAETNPVNNSHKSRVSDMGSPFGSGAVLNNLFGNTPSATIGGDTPGQPTTNEREEGTPDESTLPPGFASPEELDFLLKPRDALRHFGSVYLGRNSGARRSASFPKAHGKPNSKPRPVAATGSVQVTPAPPQNNQQQQLQEQHQPWSLLDDNSKPLLNIATTSLPQLSTSRTSAEQKTSPEWLGIINTELKSLTQHIKISGTGQQAKLYEIAALLGEIKKQQKKDSEALAKALQTREDQNKKGLDGFVDDSLKFMVEVLLLCFLCIGILLQYQSYSFQAEKLFSKLT
ncbi:uncharacterized protein TRUGW13939_04031 [Talaromyces rugulosus]|uniref:Uncharacterized protein n=1 Tax=Talaromyces rugulosus TaxID=121627 RepID=A0A7H8QVQ7_TALRU|nr:uncharacterized protein TRUGW13939_04031 [Talaromyces rugulosus]QKX56923.1 hypothetical protein TRUGW13939_04031 [Talaromyces rugulosus]